jgi:hypothetical protein
LISYFKYLKNKNKINEHELKFIELLIKNEKVDLKTNNNIIRWISKYGHLEIVKLLLKDKRVKRNK